MRTALPNAARDTVAPTLQKAQETLTDTVLPAVRDALVVAKERSGDLLDHDITLEARRRGKAVVKAAKGEVGVAAPRPWKFGLGMIAFGAGLGVVITWLARRLATPVDSYTQTRPVPSGTDGGVTTDGSDAQDAFTDGLANGATSNGAGGSTPTGAAPAGTPVQNINLRSGAPTNV